MIEHIELFYILRKQSRISHCMCFITEYIQSHFPLTFGHLDIIYNIFDWRKVRIPVFNKREHMVLEYILEERVEKGIGYFF